MSLYGPRLRLPKIDIPTPSNPSWNLDKEKKWIAAGIAVVIIAVLIILFGPMVINGISEALGNTLNPSLQINWKNNPLDLRTNPVDAAELTLNFKNNTKENQDVTFSINLPNEEIIPYCPTYHLETIAPEDERIVVCLFRRSGEIFTGTYTVEINSNLGNTKTRLEVIGK